jgi:diguanylate cyclase (GGDEF)-like protein
VPAESRDPLTGLPDRAAFRARLRAERDRSAPRRRPFGLILFDVDRLKVVNYGYGEQYGDALLRWLPGEVGKILRPRDRLGRWSGQEFLCLLPETGQAATESMAEALRKAIESASAPLLDLELRITASFATASFPDDGDSIDRLLAALGAALHQAKTTGRNRVVPASRVKAQIYGVGRTVIQALREQRVVPAYQPIVDLKTGQVVGEESLARIVTPGNHTIAASAFIDAARELQLSYEIDRAIILQTFSHCVSGLQHRAPRLHFVNISANLLRHPEVVEQLLEEAQRACTGCAELRGPEKPLVIEVTERELIYDIETARRLLKPFLDFGLRLALDDFGSGYSSYAYLADLPFSFLKIEGGLIRRVREPRVRSIVQGIQRTAAELGVVTLAEFIEDAGTAAVVRDLGIDWGQGYHFGKPALPGTGNDRQ